MLNTENHSLISNEPEVDDVEVSAVEAWLDRFPEKRVENKPNHGIIVRAPIVTITGTKRLSTLSTKERREALAKAKREHKEAMRNLAESEAQTAKQIAEQRKIWMAESEKNSEQVAIDDAAKKAAAKERYKETALKKREAKRLLSLQSGSKQPRHVAITQVRNERQESMKQDLLAGKKIMQLNSSAAQSSEDLAAYKLQNFDIRAIAPAIAKAGKSLIRVRPSDGSTAYHMIDDLERHTPAAPIAASVNLGDKNSREVLRVLCSGKVLLASDMTGESQYKSTAVNKIGKTYGINISSIYQKTKLLGWVVIDSDTATPDAPVAAETVAPVVPVSRVKEHERQMISEFAQRISKNYMSVGDAMLELQKIKERGIEFAYLEFERVAGECDSTIDAILSANRK